MIEHDRLFKEVLRNFFVEFVELFLPKMAAYMDSTQPQPMDKELFGQERRGKSSQVDVLMKAKFKNLDTGFLVHIEAQAKPQKRFGLRLLRYYVLLKEEYDLKVYPVVIFSSEESKKKEDGILRERFPDREVLKFRYEVIQLNRLDWRHYVDVNNPVAAAFMAKMKIDEEERSHVKLKCMMKLLGMKLEPQKKSIISEFIDTYLELSEEEEREYEAELQDLEGVEANKRGEEPCAVSGWQRAERQEGTD